MRGGRTSLETSGGMQLYISWNLYHLLLRYNDVLNTILYNWYEGIKDEVQRKTSTSITATAAISSTTNSTKDNNDAIAIPINDALFDRKIDLITEGIDSFFKSNLRELSPGNTLTIVNYIISMKNEINISDNYRKLNIYALYRISKFFNN
ncbi:hypothetical protein BH18THE2_BH18THE2_30210 [soil metagenome]